MRTCEIESGIRAKASAAVAAWLADRSDGEIQLNGSGAVAELEGRLCRHYGMRYALCVSSATAGLFAVALALDLRDSEFVTTPYTWGGTLASWLLLGNRPRFADIEPDCLTLDPESAEKTITRKTRALLAVDINGYPADMERLRALCDQRRIWYISDGAQSFGASRNHVPAGSLADAAVVSFTAGKPLFAGEGGVVMTNNRWLYERLIWATQHPHRQRRDIGLAVENQFAFNARIHPLAAVWANAVFDDTLRWIESWREECLPILEAVNQSGLATACGSAAPDKIEASFYRPTALWNGKRKPVELLSWAEAVDVGLRQKPQGARLIYRQSSFQAQFARQLAARPSCPVARELARRVFCVFPHSGAGEDQILFRNWSGAVQDFPTGPGLRSARQPR